MSGKIIVITGASGGLAQAMVKHIKESDFLILLGRNKAQLEEIYQIRKQKKCYQIDITNADAIENLVAELYQEFGHIDILINNAGYGAFKAFDDYGHQEIESMFKVNTFASMDFCRLIGARMAARGSGHIINIVSMAGLVASSKSSLYSASKFAMIGYSNALRLELAEKGVIVTSINPGPIKTAFFKEADPTGTYLEKVSTFALDPDQVAKKVVAVFGKQKREINLPWTLSLTHLFYTLCPGLSDYLARKVFNYK
ncbi:short-chain dehydrogenase [Streptococcus penaeicida]|uniref:Short-chain dehydrogenase n=1 Tax=Streptococcus penaeicida TaxID=1765960 RepID=A0A2N8LCD2_9STRE|nr:SDR family oxidoreductase [Streptococcus penaeicida]PND47828.1 short-chain dehydrogenase [Streptococcus penaeicida]